jgi:hypothetical protein
VIGLRCVLACCIIGVLGCPRNVPLAERPDGSSDCGLSVAYNGNDVPGAIAGHYDEAFDCRSDEGGASFGGVDSAHCFRKSDGSAWRVWNTGCGWQYGLRDPRSQNPELAWQPYAVTWLGYCASIPVDQLDTTALTTASLYDPLGGPLVGMSSELCK